jgi:hypothetical protein
MSQSSIAASYLRTDIGSDEWTMISQRREEGLDRGKMR